MSNPVQIIESGMVFGDFAEQDVLHIEKTETYQNIKDHVKTVEFLYTPSHKGIFFIEAKSSTPNPNKKADYTAFINEICDKFSHSFQLFSSMYMERQQDLLTGTFAEIDYKTVKFVLVLVVNGHLEEWLPPLKAELEQHLRYHKQIWDTEIVVLNEVLAQQKHLVKKLA
ncbi:MAG: hypothetical protein E7195_01590 [Peptococcaceae bacterium]|nr:hypothetical protein [Peptococcaceae bacterium]